jgi:hypothetical protein
MAFELNSNENILSISKDKSFIVTDQRLIKRSHKNKHETELSIALEDVVAVNITKNTAGVFNIVLSVVLVIIALPSVLLFLVFFLAANPENVDEVAGVIVIVALALILYFIYRPRRRNLIIKSNSLQEIKEIFVERKSTKIDAIKLTILDAKQKKESGNA